MRKQRPTTFEAGAKMPEVKVRCPLCRKSLAWRGLHGHLRFEHSVATDRASEILAEVKESLRFEEHRVQLLEAIREHDQVSDDLRRIEGVSQLSHGEYAVIDPQVLEELRRLTAAELSSIEIRMSELSAQWRSDRFTDDFLSGKPLQLDSDGDEERRDG
jgi:hypothetical protein